jgi:hypothetical protein
MKTEDLIKITIKNNKELLKIVKFLSVIGFTGESRNEYMEYKKYSFHYDLSYSTYIPIRLSFYSKKDIFIFDEKRYSSGISSKGGRRRQSITKYFYEIQFTLQDNNSEEFLEIIKKFFKKDIRKEKLLKINNLN